MPMPRLTYKPSCISLAARAAICSRVQGIASDSSLNFDSRTRRRIGALTLADGALLDVLDRVRHVYDPLDVNARRDDVIGIDVAGLHQLLDFGDSHLGGRGHRRIKIACGLAVDEITLAIGTIGVNNGKIGDKPTLHDVAMAVEVARLFAFGDLRSHASSGEECRNPGTAGTNALGQRALRIEFDLKLAGEILLHESLVLPDIGRDHLLDLPRVEQNAEPLAVGPAIVGNDREVLHAGIADCQDQSLGNAGQAEAAGHDRHAILEQPGQRGPRVRIDLVHVRSIYSNALEICAPSPSHNGRDEKVNRRMESNSRWAGRSAAQFADADNDSRPHTSRRTEWPRAARPRSGYETRSARPARPRRRRTPPLSPHKANSRPTNRWPSFAPVGTPQLHLAYPTPPHRARSNCVHAKRPCRPAMPPN